MTKKDILLIAIGIMVVVSLGAAFYFYVRSSTLEDQLDQNEQMLQQAQDQVEETGRRVEEIAAQTAAQLESANRMITQMRAAMEESRRAEREALRQREQIIGERDRLVSQIGDQTSTELNTKTIDLISEVYPEDGRPMMIQTVDDGAYVNRAVLEVFQRALVDLRAARQSEEQLQKVNSERSKQIAKLEEVINQKDLSIDSLNNRVTSLEDHVESLLKTEDLRRERVGQLEDALSSERKRSAFYKITSQLAAVGVIVAAIL